jgi:hypothetical protein
MLYSESVLSHEYQHTTYRNVNYLVSRKLKQERLKFNGCSCEQTVVVITGYDISEAVKLLAFNNKTAVKFINY